MDDIMSHYNEPYAGMMLQHHPHCNVTV